MGHKPFVLRFGVVAFAESLLQIENDPLNAISFSMLGNPIDQLGSYSFGCSASAVGSLLLFNVPQHEVEEWNVPSKCLSTKNKLKMKWNETKRMNGIHVVVSRISRVI